MKHWILFDDRCSFCWRSVNRIRAWDKKKRFQFSPISSSHAKQALKSKYEKLKNANTLILVEYQPRRSSKVWIKGRAVMRIFWLIGGWGKMIGWLAYVPIGVDQIYSLIANQRHRL